MSRARAPLTRDELSEKLGADFSNLLLEERRLGRLAAIKETITILSRLLDDEAPDQEAPAAARRLPADGLH